MGFMINGLRSGPRQDFRRHFRNLIFLPPSLPPFLRDLQRHCLQFNTSLPRSFQLPRNLALMCFNSTSAAALTPKIQSWCSPFRRSTLGVASSSLALGAVQYDLQDSITSPPPVPGTPLHSRVATTDGSSATCSPCSFVLRQDSIHFQSRHQSISSSYSITPLSRCHPPVP